MGYLTISPNVRCYQTHHRWHFFSFRKTVHWCICIVCATQSNCCGAFDFLLLNHVPNGPEHWLQDLGSYTAVWVRVLSQKDWRNQGATSWILAMHWCSIWVKKCDFRVSPFCQVVQKHKLFGAGIVKRLLIACFIGNISAKKYQNTFTYVKVTANQRWDVFWDTVLFIDLGCAGVN